jgi:hypothetical protein
MKLNLSVSKEKQTNTPKCLSMKESKKSIDIIHEFRRYLILEDQYKQMESEYNDKKEKIK